ncbi:MAG: hypothetical protein MJ090_05545 [Clostridia bacterium]|nr:hypothetical protein [Clostridia bacterium]
MIESVLKWVIPTLLGSTLTYIVSLFNKNKALKTGLQCLLRAEIIRSYDKYTARGEIPIYAKEALEKEYKAYHKLGGNDVATDLYHQTIKLSIK